MQLVRLSPEQVKELALLGMNHQTVYLYQKDNMREVIAQFEFPYEYSIDVNGNSRSTNYAGR